MKAMGKTATQVAEELGCTVATISRWAKKLNVGRKYGSSFVFLPKEIKQISKEKQDFRGRPKKNLENSSR